MLGFQAVQGQRGEDSVNYCTKCLCGITVIPVFPGKTVPQFSCVVFRRIPDKTDSTDNGTCPAKNNNPGGGTAGTDTGAQIADK